MNYKFHDKIVIRTPVNPLKTSFSDDELFMMVKHDKVREALYLSAPELLKELDKLVSIEDLNNNKKLKSSALKYLYRMHTRCTPFGLFSGVGASKWYDNFEIDLNNDSRSTRLDMMFSFALCQHISSIPSIKDNIKFYRNTSIYDLFGNIRYIYYYFKNNRRIHQLCEVQSSTPLRIILERAKSGVTIAELCHLLSAKGFLFNEANVFINEIIAEQLLISEIDVSLRGEEPLEIITKVLDKNYFKLDESARKLISRIKEISSEIKALDQRVLNTVPEYKKILAKLNKFGLPTIEGKIFQTDLIRNIVPLKREDLSAKTVSKCQSQLLKAAKILNKLVKSSENDNLKNFKEEYFNRNEYKEIPLVKAIDTESGIGYGNSFKRSKDTNPLIEGLNKKVRRDSLNVEWNDVQSFLFKKLIDATIHKKYMIEISEDEVAHLSSSDDLPFTMSIQFSYLVKTEDNLLIYLKSIGAPSAINLIGRFSASDDKTKAIAQEIAEIEAEIIPNSKIVNISHLPESRTGNILFTSKIRKYEIPYLCSSSYALENQISIDKILVSIRNNKLFLRTASDDLEIIPRIDNAHNFAVDSLPIYHFLCDMQAQNKRIGLMFDWGTIANLEFNFFPRVQIENVIISPATWKFKKESYVGLIDKSSEEPNFTEFESWIKLYQLPKLIILVEGDNELLVNLQDNNSIEMFMGIIAKKENILIKEFLFQYPNSGITDKNGNYYANEIIGTLVRNQKNNESKVKRKQYKLTNVDRKFAFGSEWLYFKIFCGVESSDKVLLQLGKLTTSLENNKLIKCWFFIRYSENGNSHLRFRLLLADNKPFGHVIEQFNMALKRFIRNELIWKIETDTYVRELERYGMRTIVNAEKFFYNDSVSILNLLAFQKKYGKDRWEIAVCYVDILLDKFGFTLNDKKAFCEKLRKNYYAEFNLSKDDQFMIDKRYRETCQKMTFTINEYKKRINEILQIDIENISVIRRLINPQEMPYDMFNVFSSFVHMSLNRIFKSDLRINELIVYDFLFRKYRSDLAKGFKK